MKQLGSKFQLAISWLIFKNFEPISKIWNYQYLPIPIVAKTFEYISHLHFLYVIIFYKFINRFFPAHERNIFWIYNIILWQLLFY